MQELYAFKPLERVSPPLSVSTCKPCADPLCTASISTSTHYHRCVSCVNVFAWTGNGAHWPAVAWTLSTTSNWAKVEYGKSNLLCSSHNSYAGAANLRFRT